MLWDLGLDRSCIIPRGWNFTADVSFLKAGIVWADAVTTVSPTYAREIQTPEYGFGLDGLLRSRASKLTGILNGVDYGEWDPSTDPLSAGASFPLGSFGKAECQAGLAGEMGLPQSWTAR